MKERPCIAGALHLAAGFVLACATVDAATPFSDGKVGFSVRVRDEVSPYGVLGLSVSPGEKLRVEVGDKTLAGEFELTAVAGQMTKDGPRRWTWQAPAATGLYPLEMQRRNPDERMTLNAFVIVPRSRVQQGRLNGYRIGDYPATALKGLAIYRPPTGFIEVTRENEDTLVSPHFRLKQFLCKQDGDYPKYVVLRERLLLKLELILQEVNAKGFRCDSFHVMSGYRTPFYNAAIGNVKYSRHVWGGAADIFIDEHPRDGMMDDLNGDGQLDAADARVLYRLIDDLYGRPSYKPFMGGLGRYKKTAAHGPFVHVDVRGFRARWGD